MAIVKSFKSRLGKYFSVIRDRAHLLFLTSHLIMLRYIRGICPIGLNYWSGIRSVLCFIFRKPDVLFLPNGVSRDFSRTLSVPELQKLLERDGYDGWALDPESLEIVWSSLWNDRPQVILEFGSGISTLVLAQFARLATEKHKRRVVVVSVEQSRQFKDLVEERLKMAGLIQFVHIFYAPLNEQHMYCQDALEGMFSIQGIEVEWLLIDGPSGPPGCRSLTLPSLLNRCTNGARWFLDDAFRDGELQILRSWQKVRGITIEGIFPVGKGLATGVIED